MSDAATPALPIEPVPTLRRRVLRAGAWTLGGHFGVQALRLAGNLVMTRLLVPEMFGVMTVTYVFMTALTMFSDLGVTQSIVQSRRGEDPSFLHTAWTVQILRGALIWVVALAWAAALGALAALGLVPAGTVYADPMLPPVLGVLSIMALIAGFESNRISLLRRRLELSRLARLEIFSTAASLLVMLAWALVDRSIWALVAGGLAGAVARTMLSHLALPGPGDRPGFERASLIELIGFGKWIVLSSILGFLVINGDRLLLGGLVDAQTLGIFSIAATLILALETIIAKLVGDVALPALSEVTRNDPARVTDVFYRFHRGIGMPTMAAVGALYFLGPTIVEILYDDRYRAAGAMLSILGIGLATTPARLASQCFVAQGRSSVIGLLTMVRLPALFLLTPLAFHAGGLHAALWAIVGSALTCVPLMWLFQRKAGLLDWRREAVLLLPLVAGLAAGYALAWISQRHLLAIAIGP